MAGSCGAVSKAHVGLVDLTVSLMEGVCKQMFV